MDEREKRLRDTLRDKEQWKFKRGKRFWGFWVLMIGFALFLLTQFVIRPMIGG